MRLPDESKRVQAVRMLSAMPNSKLGQIFQLQQMGMAAMTAGVLQATMRAKSFFKFCTGPNTLYGQTDIITDKAFIVWIMQIAA